MTGYIYSSRRQRRVREQCQRVISCRGAHWSSESAWESPPRTPSVLTSHPLITSQASRHSRRLCTAQGSSIPLASPGLPNELGFFNIDYSSYRCHLPSPHFPVLPHQLDDIVIQCNSRFRPSTSSVIRRLCRWQRRRHCHSASRGPLEDTAVPKGSLEGRNEEARSGAQGGGRRGQEEQG